MSKIGLPNPGLGNAPLTFVIDVRNLGDQTASPVRLIDTPPANFTYTSFSTTSGSCSIVGSLTGGEFDCSLGAILPGGLVTVTVVGYVPLAGLITNTAVVDPFGQVTEFDETNNTAEETIDISPAPPS